MGPDGSRDFGITLLEVLILLAVLGIMFAFSPISLRAPAGRLFSNDVKSQINQARYESIKRNRPVAVVWNSGEATLETRLNEEVSDLNAACYGSAVRITNRKSASDYRGVSVSAPDAAMAIAFLPSGQARWCDGSVFSESAATLVVEDGRSTRTITVSSVGKVSIL